MLDNIANVVYLVVGVLTLAGVVGGILYLVVRASYIKAETEGLQQSNVNLRARVDDLEDAAAQHALNEKAWKEERERLMAENQTLLLAATQRAEVDLLREQITNNHAETIAAWGRIEALLGLLVEKGGSPR